jgi:hypothetical protein
VPDPCALPKINQDCRSFETRKLGTHHRRRFSHRSEEKRRHGYRGDHDAAFQTLGAEGVKGQIWRLSEATVLVILLGS